MAGADGRARLWREAQAMAKLAHPNVVPIYEVSEHDGRLVVAMEYVEGQTLRAFCREAPWEEVLAAGIQAGRGIAAAHDAGLVHRDIKPDNILIGKDGRARVVDFGLARRRAPGDATPSTSVRPMLQGDSALDGLLTRAGTLMGTPNYMAPEQLDGEATAMSDQWSFCVTLYEMLYGELPFDMANRLVLRPAPPGTTLPAWVRSALVRGLSVKPEDRWPNIHALIDTLDEILAKEDYPGHSVSRRERFRLVLLLGILPITIAFFVLGRFAPMTRPIHLFWVGGLSTTAILTALVVFRRPLSKNEVNRRIGYLIALATGVTFVHRGLAVVMNEPVERAMVTDLLLYTGVLSAAALVTRRRFLVASGICVVGAVLAALLPAYATAIYLVAMQASVATVLWFWRQRA
jgi:eukaryotic-like serine/threonine-protein kinase